MTSYQRRYVFVVGTGRSGTTILARTLGRHSLVFAFPKELRLIADPDGLVDLQYVLVEAWDPFRADMALLRFNRLFDRLVYGRTGPYAGMFLHRVFDRSRLEAARKRYLNALRIQRFAGSWVGRGNTLARLARKFVPEAKDLWRRLGGEMSYVPPVDRDCFQEATGTLLKDIGTALDVASEVEVVLDHSPFNLLHVPFIRATLPDARVIHIRRARQDVASSFQDQLWAPSDPELARRMVDDLLEFSAPFCRGEDPLVFEVSLEDFVFNTRDVLERICSFIGLELEGPMLEMDLSRHNIGRGSG